MVWVNIYLGRSRRHTVNGVPVAAVVHADDCVSTELYGDGPTWTRFATREDAEAHFGPATATCRNCLRGQGTHLDPL